MTTAIDGGLRSVAPDLWTAEHLMRFPGGLKLPIRMTVMRLPDGGLMVHAPVPPNDALFAAVERLGPVRAIVAPNALHHLFVTPWRQRHAEARVFISPALRKKRPDLAQDEALSDEPPAAWRGTVDQVLLAGAPKLDEVVFFHRPSGSLLCTDLLFNVTEPDGWVTGLTLRMMGTHKRLGMSRAWKMYRKDPAALRASLERALAWPFVRILPGHGAIFEAPDAPARAREAMGMR